MNDSNAETTYRGPELPAALGNNVRLALGLNEPPTTFGDWLIAMARIADRDGVEIDLDVLCTTADSPHRARFDGRTAFYRCVQDPIIVPFLADGVDVVEIDTRSPVDGEAIHLTVTETGIDADPADAVFSIGVAADVEGPPDDVPSPVLAYGLFCPYGHAFGSEGEYEVWAEGVEAITMSISMKDTFELARAIGRIAR